MAMIHRSAHLDLDWIRGIKIHTLMKNCFTFDLFARRWGTGVGGQGAEKMKSVQTLAVLKVLKPPLKSFVRKGHFSIMLLPSIVHVTNPALHVQGWAREWALGCVSPSGLRGMSSRSLGPTLLPISVDR